MRLDRNSFCIMRLCHHHKDASLEWAVCCFDESFSELSALCDDASLVDYAIEHFGSEKRRCEWLAARVLINRLVGYSAEVCYSADGKPFFRNDPRCLSISHTDGYVAVALHREYNVGVDVEVIGAKVSKLYHRFFSLAEINSLDKKNELLAMLLHWSAKESFYKIIGNKGGSFAENFTVSPFTVCTSGEFLISYTDNGNLIKKLPVNYFVESDYVFTLCVDNEL